MPDGVPGQRMFGRTMSERELFSEAIANIKKLRDCYRGLALSRNDERWLVPARLMEELEDRTKKLMTQRQTPYLILPRRQ